MDILQHYDIYIDKFPAKDHLSSTCTFFLTHLHTDHFAIPLSFCGDIYTTSPLSVVTDFLPNTCCSVCVLAYDTTYTTHHHNIEYRAFHTYHTPSSCGFLFPTLDLIYLGDGRMTRALMQNVPKSICTILYDGLFENSIVRGKEDYTLLRSVLETLPYRAIRCVHYGILSYIKACINTITFRIDEGTVPLLIQRFIHYIGLYDENSEFIIIGPGSTYKTYILPSAMWFVTHQKDISTYHLDGDIVRIFASCHATPTQIQTWKSTFSEHHFIPITTRPI